MYTFAAAAVLSVSVMTTLGRPQYVEPEEIPGHLDDAYQFAYAVASPEHGDYHGHQQSRDENGFTSGSYYLLGADGQWSQTIYADKGLGYQTVYNQRPAGAPPPQVSEVTYQIFVHPGATAISAQGGGEAPAPLPSVQPFGGIRQESLVDPNLAQQGRRVNREIISSQILPIGDPTVDAAFAPYYTSNAVQQENVYSPRLRPIPARKTEASPEILVIEEDVYSPQSNRNTEVVEEYVYSPQSNRNTEVVEEYVYSPQLSRKTEASPVILAKEPEPAPEPHHLRPAKENDDSLDSRFARKVSSVDDDSIKQQLPSISLNIPGAVN